MRRLGWVALAVVLAGSVACGTERAERGDAERIWQQSDPWVRVGAPDPLLLPGSDPPAGTILASLTLPQEPALPATGAADSAQTLWADPDEDDPLDGPALLVGRTSIADEGDFLREGRPFDLAGRPARLEHRGPVTIISWRLDVPSEVCIECEQSAVVAGRGLSESEVTAAARAAQPSELRPTTDPGAVPAGLRSLGTMPGMGQDQRWYELWEQLHLYSSGDRFRVRMVGGDPRLLPHLRFWVDAGRSLAVPDPLHADVIAVGDRVAIVEQLSGRRPDDGLETFIASFTDASEDEARAARRRVIERPADAADECSEGVTGEVKTVTTFAGALDDVRWSLTVSGDDRGMAWCYLFDRGSARDVATGGGGGSPARPPAEPSSVRILEGVTEHAIGEQPITLVLGDAPAGATRVAVAMPGNGVVDAQLADVGPASDRRWFAIAIRLEAELPGGSQSTAVAYDAAGNEIGRTPPG